MSDVIAVPRERIVAELSAFVRTPFGGQCVRIGLAALASAVAALIICAVLPNSAKSSAPAMVLQTGPSSAARQTGAGIDVATAWAAERALLDAATNPDFRNASASAWSPAGGISTLLATRFPSAGEVLTVEAGTTVPLPAPAPVARLGGIGRAAVGHKPPGQQLASLPPQTPEPGYFDFFRKLFGDPDRTARAMLAANPKAAIYDIERRAIYLPDGDKLEAHSGFGQWMDDPTSIKRKNLGVTPPNVYALSFREQPFHGDRALRMTPVDKSKMYGRDGMLTHSFLLGQNGQSNGCVSIRNYEKFLRAYENGTFKKLIVVPRVDETAPARVASTEPGNV